MISHFNQFHSSHSLDVQNDTRALALIILIDGYFHSF